MSDISDAIKMPEGSKRYLDFVNFFMEAEPLYSSEIFKYEVNSLANFLSDIGYFEAPASINHHGNEEGGLFAHSMKVAQNLVMLTEKLNLLWSKPESPYVVGLLHDICKCDNYMKIKDGEEKGILFGDDKSLIEITRPNEHWEYNNASILTGHGEKSVIMAQKIWRLNDEEIACIRWHMGAFDDKENWNHYGHAVTLYPNVLWTHTADMMAARIDGV